MSGTHQLKIIDNFYSDPDLVRNLALNETIESVTHLNYPGTQSLLSFFSNEVIDKIESVIGETLFFDKELNSFGKFRFMDSLTGSRLKVHLDGSHGWTALIYLNPTAQCRGGTSFYKHIASQCDGPPSRRRLQELGFASYDDFEQQIITPDTLNLKAWEEIDHVPMVYNRMVIFKGSEVFHCHTQSFGTNLANSRLTQNFFFDGKQKCLV